MNTVSSTPTQLVQTVREILFDLSGFEIDHASSATSFMELGFDSLFLIQFSTSLKQTLGVEVSFRQMLEESSNFDSLVSYVGEQLPPDAFPADDAKDDSPQIDSLQMDDAIPAGISVSSHQENHKEIREDEQGFAAYHEEDEDDSWYDDEDEYVETSEDIDFSIDSTGGSSASGVESIMNKQLELMAMQLDAMRAESASKKRRSRRNRSNKRYAAGSTATSQQNDSAPAPARTSERNNGAVLDTNVPARETVAHRQDARPQAEKPKATPAEDKKEMKPFGAIARIQTKQSEDLPPQQQEWFDDFIKRYNEMTAKSKEFTAKYQKVHADPRVVSGFKSKTKELIYPIVASRTNGCRIWDLDGNEYVDALNGFGSNFFGYANPDITQAVVDQMWRGVEIGPQCPLTGEAAELVCEFTGMERVGFCNTGSEAVMGAMRIARTVTGRSLIVTFSGSYHGIFDEVIVRSTPQQRSMPAAPGIMRSAVENVLVLEYGTEESLQIIRDRIDEFAAVMVEPVQSRRPEFQPREFLQELRQITAENDVPFIFDEVITGFRTAPGGAQEFFDIEADIATYGKVVGGGMHIGIVAGKAKYMDALDGGPWQYGDDSVPEVGVTYFAGTFVRHPASIAACLAALRVLKREGPELQQRVNAQTTYLVSELNNFFSDRGVPLEVNYFSSLWRMTYTENVLYGETLFYLIREHGVHIYDGFPCFITMAHTDEDVEIILNAIKKSVLTLQSVGFLPQIPDEVAQADFFAQAS